MTAKPLLSYYDPDQKGHGGLRTFYSEWQTYFRVESIPDDEYEENDYAIPERFTCLRCGESVVQWHSAELDNDLQPVRNLKQLFDHFIFCRLSETP